MKYLFIMMMLITPSCTVTDIDQKSKAGHETQKKQFVNFINDDGEYARNYVDLTNNEANSFDDIFRGRGGGGPMIDGAMQLNENSMGGLALDGDDMEGTYNQLGVSANQLSSFEDGAAMGERGSASSTLQGGQSMGQEYSNEGGGGGLSFNSPSFFGTFDVSTGNEDILSPFYSSEGKLEDSINLSDNMNTPGHIDMATFNEALQGLNDKEGNLLKVAGKPKGVTNAGSLNSELGEMESSDDKLQKLLETSIGNNNDEDSSNSATVGSFLNALLSQGSYQQHPQHLQPTQTQPQEENQGSIYDMNQQDQYQQNALNQLSGTMAQNGMGAIQPVTVHVHASDKPGHKDAPPPPEQSRAVAQQAQEIAMKQHKAKLAKLKKRLALLREKLTELEDEQAKKSTSNKNNDPKQARNDAIKKLLIKNLKLAALIASKEIQLEEEKSRGLEYLSGKKEDGAVMDDVGLNTGTATKFIKSKPLTELSKKAEEEVNHLSNTERVRSNSSTYNSVSPALNETKVDVSKSTLNRINKTLQELDIFPTVNQRSLLATSSRIFLNKLKKQIRSMSPDQAHAVEEKALATLFKAIKAKEDFVNMTSERKRRRIPRKYNIQKSSAIKYESDDR